MNSHTQLPDDLRAEVYRLGELCLSGTASNEEQQQLEALLASRDQARRDYWSYVVDSVNLRLITDANLTIISVPAEASLIDPALLRELQQSTTMVAHRPTNLLQSVCRGIINSPLVTTLLVATVVYGIFGYLVWDLRSEKLPGIPNGSRETLVMIADTIDAVWSDQSATRSKSTVKYEEQLRLKSGTVELELAHGTKVSVQGPAEWSIGNGNAVILDLGTLVARVPERGIGFTVSTPTATVIDLGTEFGVQVSADGAADIAVLEGQVDVKPKYRTVQSTKPRRLVAGESVRVDAKGGLQDRGSAMAVFTPLADRMRSQDISVDMAMPEGIRLWLRADQGVELDAEGRVERWRDQSAGGFDAVQSNPQQRPLSVTKTAQGTGRAIVFDGQDDFLTCDHGLKIDNGGDMTLFLLLADVPKFTTNAGVFCLRPRAGVDGRSYDGFGMDLDNVRSPTGINAVQGVDVLPRETGWDPIVLCGACEARWPLMLVVTKQQGTATIRINGQTRAVDTYNYDAAKESLINTLGYSLGNRIGSDCFSNICVAELLVFDRAFTGRQATSIERKILASFAQPIGDP